MKKCVNCEFIKSKTEFNKRSSNKKDGLQSYCRICQQADWVNRDMKEHKKEYRQKENVKKHESEYKKGYYLNNKEQFKINKENNKPRRNEIYREKYNNCPDFLIVETLRKHVNNFLKSKKEDRSSKYIGCSVKFFRSWIEFQFNKNMTWKNHGNCWHLDHLLPKSKFDPNDKTDVIICCHWTNYQPLTKSENLVKNNNIRLYEKMNSIININRFLNKQEIHYGGYQVLNESLKWLREKLRYGNNPNDDNLIA